MCKRVAESWGLPTRTDATLWKDKVMHLLDEAIVQSFRSSGWSIVDHHTMLRNFWEWYNKEISTRGYCPGKSL